MAKSGFIDELLLKLGLIAMLAGFFPPAVQLFDLITCDSAEAVVTAAQPAGPVTVTFHTRDGQTVTTQASPYHMKRTESVLADEHPPGIGGSDATRQRLATLLHNQLPASMGEYVGVIYRKWNPMSLAPHRKITDSLIGVGALMLGALLLLLRRALRRGGRTDLQPEPAEPRRRTTSQSRADATHRPPRTPPRVQPADPSRPQRVGVVQRERGWFG